MNKGIPWTWHFLWVILPRVFGQCLTTFLYFIVDNIGNIQIVRALGTKEQSISHAIHTAVIQKKNEKHWLLRDATDTLQFFKNQVLTQALLDTFPLKGLRTCKQISLTRVFKSWLQKCRRTTLFISLSLLWSAEIFDRAWTRNKKRLRVLLFPPLQKGISYFDADALSDFLSSPFCFSAALKAFRSQEYSLRSL